MTYTSLPDPEVMDKIKSLALPTKQRTDIELAQTLATDKVTRLNTELDKLLLFPDARKAEIYTQMVEGGELTALPPLAIKLPLEYSTAITAEYQKEVDALNAKIARLSDFVTNAPIELALRDAGLVVRKIL